MVQVPGPRPNAHLRPVCDVAAALTPRGCAAGSLAGADPRHRPRACVPNGGAWRLRRSAFVLWPNGQLVGPQPGEGWLVWQNP